MLHPTQLPKLVLWAMGDNVNGNLASRGRQTWMDLVRGSAIVMVVCHHSLYLTTLFLGASPEPLRWLDRFWEPFRMPALVFLSGMLLSRSLRKRPLPFVAGKARGLAWPYWLWSSIILSMSSGISLDALVHVLLVPPTYLWYLWYLFVYYLTALALTRLGVPVLTVVLVSYITSMFITEWLGLANFFYLFVFFMLGHLYVLHEACIRDLLSPRWVAAALLAVSICTGLISAAGVGVKFEAVWIIGVLAATAFALRIAPTLPETAIVARARWVGENSIVFYLAHWPAMWATCSLLVDIGVNSPTVYIGLNLAVGLLSGWALATSRQRLPIVDALFVWPRLRGATTPS